MKQWKPGEKATKTGKYALVNADGSKTGFTVQVHANDHFPPADKDGQVYTESN